MKTCLGKYKWVSNIFHIWSKKKCKNWTLFYCGKLVFTVIFFSPCKGNHVSSLQKFELKLNTRWSNYNYIKYMLVWKKAQSTEFNSIFKIHFIDYGKLRLKVGYFDFIVKIAPPSIKNDFIIKHFISKLLTNAWFLYTVHCVLSLWTHILNSQKAWVSNHNFFMCSNPAWSNNSSALYVQRTQ